MQGLSALTSRCCHYIVAFAAPRSHYRTDGVLPAGFAHPVRSRHTVFRCPPAPHPHIPSSHSITRATLFLCKGSL
ncbi:hypothetical protein PO909_004564 [Leuciscus waleckii]